MPACSAIDSPAMRQGPFCASTLSVTPPSKNSSVPDGSIDSCGTPSMHEIGADPFRLELGDAHALGDDRQLVGGHDRQLPLVAHLGAARVPGLATTRRARVAGMHVAFDAVEAEPQRVDRLGDEILAERGEDADDTCRRASSPG